MKNIVAGFKSIEDISDVKLGCFITDNHDENRQILKYLRQIPINLEIIDDMPSITPALASRGIDIFILDQCIDGDTEAGVKLCTFLREQGYKGIIILCIEETLDKVSNYIVTSIGFDNFIPKECTLQVLLNQLHWAILNRRRKLKNNLHFDNNPDALYILDASGIIYDINETATNATPHSPKHIVTLKINVRDIGTLPTFGEHIKPLITMENAGRVFEHTSTEGAEIFQVKVKISNLPIIGLVAVVFKTRITQVMFTRTLDILTNSIAMLSHRDNYTAGHSSRVFYYCVQIVNEMNFSVDKKFTKSLYCAALLHDIGKIGVKDKILLKPGRLNEEEYNDLCSHPLIGCDMLERFRFLDDSIDFIRYHHERPDGNGYPEKLQGPDIPIGAAIIAVADSFDAMTSNRPYRKSLDYNKAIKELEDFAGVQFDYDVTHAFLRVINRDLMRRIKRDSRSALESIASEILAI